MDQRQTKLKRPWLSGGLVLLILLANPLSFSYVRDLLDLNWVEPQFLHEVDAYFYLPLSLCFFAVFTLFFVQREDANLQSLFKASPGFNLILFLSLSFLVLFTNGLDAGRFRLVRILGLLLLLTQGLRLAALWWVHPDLQRRLQGWKRTLSLVIFPLLLLLVLLEIPFLFVSSSHNFIGTLASRTWVIDHTQRNSWGYRDKEYSPADLKNKRVLWVVGDSFVEGYGMENEEDRFSEVLAKELGEDWVVLNAGKGGSDVWDATERIKLLPVKPDKVLFSYFPNDMDMDCSTVIPYAQAKSYHDLPPLLRFFVRRSYLLNYLYWKYPHPGEMGDYNQRLCSCYEIPEVWERHTSGLDSLVALSRRSGFELMAVVWPLLNDAKGFEEPAERISGYFQQNGVPVLNLTPLLRDIPPDSLMVNPNDYHPSKKVHRLVGNALVPMFR